MESELSILWRVRRTVSTMLVDRGYILTEEELKMSQEEFKSKFGEIPQRDKLTQLASKADNTDSIFVFFAEEEKIGVKPIKNYVNRMETEHISRAILILRGGITTFAKKILQEMQFPADSNKEKRHVELFEENELLINITQHVFVPKHQLLTDAEKAALLKKYKLKDTQLPRIQLIDPIARYYGLSKGQVVKITRPSETAGKYVTYRLVV
jgi:DNA-directed RNA polymerase I, II, and III subunit RPABC1